MTAGRVDLTPAGGVMVDAEALRMLLAKHDVARVTYTATLVAKPVPPRPGSNGGLVRAAPTQRTSQDENFFTGAVGSFVPAGLRRLYSGRPAPGGVDAIPERITEREDEPWKLSSQNCCRISNWEK